MADRFFSLRNLQFLVHDVHDAAELTRLPRFQDQSGDSIDMVLDAAAKLATNLLQPIADEMDKQPPHFDGATVRVHPAVKRLMKEYGDGGWIAAHADYERGGQQLPNLVNMAAHFIFAAANYSASVYLTLTAGAVRLLEAFGSPELCAAYAPSMHAGRWQGTMALTEPQAGSSLADVACAAEPTGEGFFRLRGQKLFISAADHDGVENVVNMLLARVAGDPPGVKGISLFLVPKRRLDPGGEPTDNDIATAAVYHKLGYRGAPITQLSLGERGDCRGWLVGERRQGLRCMFQMMNESRLEVGVGAAGIASAAYYASLQYARERTQGRKPGEKDPMRAPVPLIEHADIRRMLLFQRAVTEGSLSLLLQCAKLADLAAAAEGAERDDAALLLDLLTPIAKSYPAEMAIHAASAGLQVLGGYGYCDEFPLERLWRDARIHPIHEGTTGIQAIDLLGRKVSMRDGRALALFVAAVEGTVAQANASAGLAGLADELAAALRELRSTTADLSALAGQGGQELFLADATLYLEAFGLVAIAWQWLRQAVALGRIERPADAAFRGGKLAACRYFFAYELPKLAGLLVRLRQADGLTVRLDGAAFDD
jgi:butyryl-CoA dehydrogenase